MKREIKITISEICYYLFFCILLFAKAVGLYDGQPVFKICLVAAAFFVFLKIVLTKYTIKEFVAILALIALGGVIYINSGEKSALVFLVMMIGFKNIPLERIMKVGLVVWSVGFGALVLMSMLGAGEELAFAHHKFGIDMLRRGMGYSHPNVLHVSYAILVVFVLFGIQNKDKLKAYLWVFAGNIVVFLYSASYTGFMLVVFFLFFNIYFTYRKQFSKVEGVLIQSVFPVCVLFALFAPLIVEPDTPLFLILNKLLNRRFYASRLYLQENPITLFGNRIYASHTYALDSSYVTLLLYGGLVLFLLVCAAYIYSIYFSMRKKDAKAISILLSFAIAGVIEPFLFNFSFKNLSLLFVAGYLFSICDGGKEVALLSHYDKSLSVGVPKCPISKNIQSMKQVVFISFVMAMVAGGCFYLFVEMPESVYVTEKYCDIEGEVFYPDKAMLKASENVVFYGDVNSEEGVYEFGGDTIAYEKVRDTIRLVYVVFLVGYLGLPYVLGKGSGTDQKRNEKKQEDANE